ncbi:uncharacterized protein K02A2.6-like [Oncorhynchus mykiss]|uniref:uncharacterized protein K02A2.6-like n=1 Tax=Oncorhynchus mykiss TaxID=8022 RepID=UPI001878E30C|nr:uncharacterized protein K02A2.6-like [Oncorhynchus mykiss]
MEKELESMEQSDIVTKVTEPTDWVNALVVVEKPRTGKLRNVKDLITREPGQILAYYDPNKELRLQVDTSKYGLGAVLLQEGKPIGYASKSLTDSEINYAQIKKELYAILFGWILLSYRDMQKVRKVFTRSVMHVVKRAHKVSDAAQDEEEDFTAKVRVQEGTKPVFHKPRPVPYALKEAVEKELDRLQKNNIITKVARSDWAAPIVEVPKKDKTVRMCGDYKVTVNRCILPEEYPLTNAEDLFATLAGGKVFSKLDLAFAYQQLKLDPESEHYLTINTHKGLFRFNRLAYGITTAPAIFQQTMDQILDGIDHVVCFMDDILVSAPTIGEHLVVLDKVMSRLEKYGVRMKRSKCEFLQDSQGGSKFVANLSTLLHPLHQLLQADTKWNWSPQCEEAFKTCKQRLLKSKWLAHYNTEMKLRPACDASPYGVGAVISHVLPSGEEHPIAFASRTLSPSKKNYAQIEKEALSIIFGVKKFQKYLYGRKFQLLTDHKPLLAILGPKSAIPTLADVRMQRWALILLAYNYEIEYRRSSDHANADALSRLPCNSDTDSEDDRAVFQISLIDELPISASDIAEETRKDPVLSKVLDLTLGGWPTFVNDDNLRPFIDKKDQLSTDQGCVLWGSRVVVPPKFQRRLLSDMHEGHPGITRMKALARSYLWWPGLDQDIQQHVGHCSPCEAVRNKPAAAPLHPWSWAATPWERIHVDYAKIDKQHFLVVVDVHSKWMEVFPTQLTTAEKTINLLRHLFASFGLVKELVSDNGHRKPRRNGDILFVS